MSEHSFDNLKARTGKQYESLKGNRYQSCENSLANRFKKEPKELEEYLSYSLKEYEKGGDIKLFLYSLRNVAKAIGWSELHRRTGISRQALYAALSSHGNPRVATLKTILHALGYSMAFHKF